MAISVDEKDLVGWLSTILRADLTEAEGEYIFSFRSNSELKLQITSLQIQSILESLNNKQEQNETALFDGRNYECLAKDESRDRMPLFRRGEGQILKEDLDNGIVYKLSVPSDEYLVFLLSKINNLGAISTLRSGIMGYRLRRIMEEEKSTREVLHILKKAIPRFLTVRVESKKTKGFQEMSRHSNAFLFQLTYNLDISVVESRYLDDLIRSGRVISGRRSTLDEIEAPKRLYIPDLIYHYQMGVTTDSPSHEYLSFYHVAEHFFEEVFNDDLVNSVRNKITQPDFSYKRKKDIQELIRDINKKLKIRDESVIFSEQEALRLTIQKYIDFSDLRDKLNNYDNTLITYYRDNKVTFSDAVEIDFTNIEPNLSDKLAKRIYKTRNAIVHSKESERSRYVPFEHDKILVKEIPLLRFISEEIIIKTSTLVG
jgi:hypothetical protein